MVKNKLSDKQLERIPSTYYSVWIESGDITSPSDIEVYKHDNDLGLSVEDILTLENHFLLKSDVFKAKKDICKILRIEIEKKDLVLDNLEDKKSNKKKRFSVLKGGK